MFRIEIESDLSLKILIYKDAPFLNKLIENNKEHLGKWLPWVYSNNQISHTENFIKKANELFMTNNGFEVGIMINDELVGVFRLTLKGNIGNIGYWICEEYEGKGFISKVVNYIISLNYYELKTYEIICPENNFRSRKVAEQNGFTLDSDNVQTHNSFGYHLVRYKMNVQ
ncbi:GNAT family N-acetyltransferase [Bacillus pumilus]|uniref:GNAT family N-acetyltransferase n=1 Tax=Bacillus pumilus TaxID=1408 RepID=UPI0011A61443|nr:GNAT family N-acetyltransferase [Bacillus pumilus]